jgi:hypothetical protein
MVNAVSEDQVQYQPINWYTGAEAVIEAEKDGCTGACAPNGFYWRYQQDEGTHQTWIIGERTDIEVKLISEGELTPVSFDDFVTAEAACRNTSNDCPYYALGTGMDFFDITFNDDGSLQSMTQRYVP